VARSEELGRCLVDLREGRTTSAAEKARLEERTGELKALIQTQEQALDEAKGEQSKKRSPSVPNCRQRCLSATMRSRN